MPRKKPLDRPRWRWTKTTVTIELPLGYAVAFARVLLGWKSFAGWTEREDCQGWKRSPIARENRRESITLGNCLSSIEAWLGRRNVRKLMDLATNPVSEPAPER